MFARHESNYDVDKFFFSFCGEDKIFVQWVYLSWSDNSRSSATLCKKTVTNDPKLPDCKLWLMKFWHNVSKRESKLSCSWLATHKNEINGICRFVTIFIQTPTNHYLLSGRLMWYWRKLFQNSLSAGMWSRPTNFCRNSLFCNSVLRLMFMPIVENYWYFWQYRRLYWTKMIRNFTQNSFRNR